MRKAAFTRVIGLAILAGVSVAAAPLRAARADGSNLIDRAVELRRSGDDQGAFELLRQANNTSHNPRAAGQLGLCEQALGRWADAETHISDALKEARDPWVRKNRATLERSLNAIKAQIARVEISGEPIGAEVLVNGTVVGSLPLAAPIRVGAGELELELRAPGRERAVKSVRVQGGEYRQVSMRAEPIGQVTPPPVIVAAPPGTVAAPPATGTPGPVAPAPSPVSRDQPESDPGSRGAAAPDDGARPGSLRRAAKWIFWGAGAAAVGVGIWGLARQQSSGNQFDSACGVDPTGAVHMQPGSTRSDAQCVDLQQQVESGYRLQLFGFAGAAILAGTGLILWLTESRGTEGTVALACSPGIGLSAGCSFRF